MLELAGNFHLLKISGKKWNSYGHNHPLNNRKLLKNTKHPCQIQVADGKRCSGPFGVKGPNWWRVVLGLTTRHRVSISYQRANNNNGRRVTYQAMVKKGFDPSQLMRPALCTWPNTWPENIPHSLGILLPTHLPLCQPMGAENLIHVIWQLQRILDLLSDELRKWATWSRPVASPCLHA
jgi:hypothetical protein